MTVEVENTPNPEVLKFFLGRVILEDKIMDFPNQISDKGQSPLVTKLFSVEGVQAVMLGKDFISVTRFVDAKWSDLKNMIVDVIVEYLNSGDDVVLEGNDSIDCNAEYDGDDEISIKIKDVIDSHIRPAVAMDGGDVQFHGFDKGVVYVALRGACAGCPSATFTLKMGIENMLCHYIPEVTEVRTVS